MRNLVEVVLKPLNGVRVKSDLAVGVFIVVDVDSAENEVRWELADIDIIKLLVLGDNNVFDDEWDVTLGESLFVNCDA